MSESSSQQEKEAKARREVALRAALRSQVARLLWQDHDLLDHVKTTVGGFDATDRETFRMELIRIETHLNDNSWICLYAGGIYENGKLVTHHSADCICRVDGIIR